MAWFRPLGWMGIDLADLMTKMECGVESLSKGVEKLEKSMDLLDEEVEGLDNDAHGLRVVMKQVERKMRQFMGEEGDTDPRTNPYEALASTRQTATVDEYVDLFISRMADVPHLSDSHALDLFLNGLHDDIRDRIRSEDAQEICAAMHLACEIELEIGVIHPSSYLD